MEKRYSLALWWWAALWLMHIWVIKYFEEKEIKIKEVSWTSMWAIVAAFFAMWKSSNFMIDFARSVNYMKFLDFDLKNWLLKWEKIYKKFEEVFWDTKIEELNVKLKIVATNVENWEKVVFEKWKIIDAIRASISLPWIFRPFKLDKSYLVDGWVLNNLPIEILDWDDVIAVSVIKRVASNLKLKRNILWIDMHVWFFNLNYQIIQRSLLLLMRQNERASIKYTQKNVMVIKPDPWELECYNFNKLDELVEKGYNEASLILKDIK